jgi:hypothetical protein
LFFGFAVSAVAATTFGSAFEARAQADLNIQSRLDSFTPPFVLSPRLGTPVDLPPGLNKYLTFEGKGPDETKGGACMSAKDFILLIHSVHPEILPIELQGLKKSQLVEYIDKKPEDADLILREALEFAKERRYSQVLDWLRNPREVPKGGQTIVAVEKYAVSLCKPRQPPTVKVTVPFNPSQESNVLKTTQNPHEDTSFGFGGSLQAVTAGVRAYDLMGLSVGSVSARYDKFPSKSFDQLLIQGAYQFFISATAYKDGRSFGVDEKLLLEHKENMPASNLITVNTLSIGFQNQRAYTPSFLLETADLITPQITLSRQNISLTGSDKNNVCEASLPDFRKSGFCYYADLSLTLGETFSDQSAQQNANVAVSATLGKRFDQSDWKLAVQTTVTERIYTDFHGGRRDVLLQVGPNLTYAAPTLVTFLGSASVQFSLPATYNQNYSTLAKAEWHGVVVMPTLTLAFQPSAPAK